MFNFTPLKLKLKSIETRLSEEYYSIRTSRAAPQLLDSVQAESYGVKMPISHLAAITVDDPRTLRITPWDAEQIKTIESAVAAANLGVSTTPDSRSIRVVFPELTEERRKILIKMAGEKLEESKVALRAERERVWNEIQKEEKAGRLSEDDKFRHKDELQKIVEAFSKQFAGLCDRKKAEIES